MKSIIAIFLVSLFASTTQAQNISGTWNGLLNVYGSQLRLVFHITKTDSGYTSTMDSPDQKAMGLPVKSTSFRGDSLVINIPQIGASYHGKLQDDFTFKGIFKQRGAAFKLNLTQKEVAKKKASRPQEPKPPFPYRSEDVTFKNTKEHVTLAGTLTMPKQGSSFPAVILISGSGPQNRNEELLGHKPFLVISDYLTRHGTAVLRFDDRGVGQSTGNFAAATTDNFATDVEAGFNYLQSRKEINPHKIGLIGHSEGGLIAPILAAKNKKVAFIVLLAGPGLPGDQILLAQEALIGKAAGQDPKKLRINTQINRKAFDIVKNTTDSTRLSHRLAAYYKQSLKDHPDVQKPKEMSDSKFINMMIKQLTNPWMRHFIAYDPRPTLQKVSCPVLALDGSHDLQVPPKEDLDAIKKALNKGGNKDVTIKELPGLNHLFQESKTGSPSEYGTIEQTFSPVALKVMEKWITRQVQ